MRLYIYPPTAVSVTVPPIAYTEGGVNTPVTPSTPLPVREFPISAGEFSFLDFEYDNVNGSTYTEIVSALGADAKEVQIFMSSGEPLYLATGAAASEVNRFIITPGGNGIIKFNVPTGERLSVKAVNSVTVPEGVLIVNYIG